MAEITRTTRERQVADRWLTRVDAWSKADPQTCIPTPDYGLAIALGPYSTIVYLYSHKSNINIVEYCKDG